MFYGPEQQNDADQYIKLKFDQEGPIYPVHVGDFKKAVEHGKVGRNLKSSDLKYGRTKKDNYYGRDKQTEPIGRIKPAEARNHKICKIGAQCRHQDHKSTDDEEEINTKITVFRKILQWCVLHHRKPVL